MTGFTGLDADGADEDDDDMSIIGTLIIAFTRNSFTILSESYAHWPQVETIRTGYLSRKNIFLSICWGRYQALTEPSPDRATQPLWDSGTRPRLSCLLTYALDQRLWVPVSTGHMRRRCLGILSCGAVSGLLCREHAALQSGQHVGDRHQV